MRCAIEPTAWEQFLRSPTFYVGNALYKFIHRASSPISPKSAAKGISVRVVCISDTHNHHDATSPLPQGDILIHAGDLTHSGTQEELFDALSWLHDQPHPKKLFIAGNHDWALTDPQTLKDIRTKFPSLEYLEDSETTVNVRGRKLVVYGSPQTPKHGSWPFQYTRFSPSSLQPGYDISKTPWSAIPPHTNILITHGPPAYHLDSYGLGCKALLRSIWTIRPRLHVFGHIHAARGVEHVSWDTLQRAYENLCEKKGGVWNLLVLIMQFCQTGLRTFWKKNAQITTFVNASVIGGFRDELRRSAIVVDV